MGAPGRISGLVYTGPLPVTGGNKCVERMGYLGEGWYSP